MTPEFDVIVVTAYQDIEGLLRSVLSVRDHDLGWRDGRTRLTLVANSEPVGAGDSRVDKENGYREFHVGHNAGWVRAANAGLSLATAPHVVLMNDDVEVRGVTQRSVTEKWKDAEGSHYRVIDPAHRNWLEKMREPFTSECKIAAVGPRSTSNQGRQGELEAGPWRECQTWCVEGADCFFEVNEDEDFDPDHKWGIGKWPLSFFCVMFSQEAIKDVGLLDLNLADGYGGDDDDWQRRAWEKGWRFAYQPEVMVAHEGNATFKERKAELQPGNIEFLRRKWGRE